MSQQTYGEWMRSNPPIPKQTAVEWLIEQLKNGIKYNPLQKNGYSEAEKKLFEQAKQMEKEQIENAFSAGYDYPEKDCEQYYNETYNNATTNRS